MSDINEIRISNMLKVLGIPCNLLGYNYIKLAVGKMLENEYAGRPSVTKVIYPGIAEHFNSTSSRVERAMRHAIECAWKKGSIDVLNEIFSYSVDAEKGRATNAEFLFSVTEYLNLHPNKFTE